MLYKQKKQTVKKNQRAAVARAAGRAAKKTSQISANLQLSRSTDLIDSGHWTQEGRDACRVSIVRHRFGLADEIGAIAM
jgi:hypothetical protein